MYKVAKEIIAEFRRAAIKNECANVWCPTCKSRPESILDGPEWAEAWGHRCRHGEPCPGFEQVPDNWSVCNQCVPQQKVIVQA